jgi:hypothetical protein
LIGAAKGTEIISVPFALATYVLIEKQVVKQFTDVALGYGDND